MNIRPLLSLIFGHLLILAIPANAQISERYRYFVNSTNEIHAVLAQQPLPNREAMLKVSAVACSSLVMLLQDKQFHEDLFRVAPGAPGTQEERRQLQRELALFVSQFLRVEEEWLNSAGVAPNATKELVWSAAMFRTALETNFDAKFIVQTIDKLRAEVCTASDRLATLETDARRLSVVRKWAFRFGGITLVVVDVGATVASAGTIGPVAAGSIAIGGAVAA